MRKLTAGVALVAGVATTVVALWSWEQVDRARSLAEWRDRLAAVADDRGRTIDTWIRERKADASVLVGFPSVILVAEGKATPEIAPRLGPILGNIATAYGYSGIWLLDRAGTVLARSSGAAPRPAFVPDRAPVAAEGSEVAIGPRGGGAARLIVAAAIGDTQVSVVLETDPSVFLYPLLSVQPHPLPVRDGEALLLDTSAGEALSPSTHAADAPWRRAALARTFAPGTSLAATRRVDGAPWTLVVSASESAALAGHRSRRRTALTIAALILLAYAGGLAALVQAQVARERGRMAWLMDQANDVLLLLAADGRILDANRKAVELYGRTAAELRSLRAQDLNVGGVPAVRANTEAVLRAGSLIFESRHRQRDGTEIPVEVSTTALAEQHDEAAFLAIIRDVRERKALEAKLHAANDRYRTFLDLSSEGIARLELDAPPLVDADEDTLADAILQRARVAEANPAWARLYGLTPSEVVGRLRSEISPPIPRELALGFVREHFRRTGDGQHIVHGDIAVHYQGMGVIEEGRLVAIWSVVRDVSVQHRAEQSQRESEQRFERLTLAAFEAIAITEQGVFLDGNPQLGHMLGCELEQLIGGHARDFVAPQDQELVRSRIGSDSEEPYRHLARRADGTIFPVEVRARKIFYRGRPARVTVLRDITAEVGAELALLASERQSRAAAAEWRRTFDAVAAGLLVLDSSGTLLRANQAGLRLLGAEAEGAASLPAEGEPWSTVRRLAATASESPALAQASAGARVWDVAVSVMPAGELEDAPRTIVVVNEVTEMHELQESLRRSERMSELGALVAGVAHEVRGPLFSVSASIDALEGELADHPAYAKFAPLLRSQVNRMSQLARDLLDYGKAPVVRESRCEPRDLLRSAVRSAILVARERVVEIVEQGGDGLPTMRVDGGRLEQALTNLIVNAIQHSVAGGAVQVAAEQGDGGGVCFVVRDDGPGVRHDDLALLFRPFFSRRKGGTGLGLAIVKQIAESHGGRITAANRAAGGAEFRLALPASSVVPASEVCAR